MLPAQGSGQTSPQQLIDPQLRPNQSREQLEEGGQLLTFEIHQQKIHAQIKNLKLIAFVAIVFAVLSLAYSFGQSRQLDSAVQENRAQSHDITTIMKELHDYKQQARASAENLTRLIEGLQMQVIRMGVDVVKNENHNKNVFDVTRFEKKDIWSSIHQLQQKLALSQPKYIREIVKIKNKLNEASFVPKTIWLYTEFPLASEKMLEQLLGYFIINKARESGFEVKIVNSWSAYQQLSNATTARITHAMQNKAIQQKVDDLLRIALLMEHGGVLIKVSETLLIDNFNWLEQHLSIGQAKPQGPRSEVVLFSEQSDVSTQPQFQDFFMAAIPQAPLLVDTFDYLCETITTGKSQFPRLKEARYIFKQVNSTRIKDLTKNLIHSLIETMTPEYYSVDVVNSDISMFIRPACRDRLAYLLKRPASEYQADCGEHTHMIHLSSDSDRRNIEDELDWELSNEVLGADRDGYWHTWMVIPENRRLFDPLPQRQVSFCVLDAHPSSRLEQIQQSVSRLKRQTYKKWTAVYFVDEEVKADEYVAAQKEKGYNITVVKSSPSIGRNYELGIIKYCPSKSFVFVLRKNEELDGTPALEMLAQSLTPRHILGAFVSVSVKGMLNNPSSAYENYNKPEYNGKEPKYEVLSNVLNYLRVFHSDCYKIIPQFNLRTPEGQYFNDRFVFLEQFLFMVRNLTDKHDDTEIPHTQRVKWFIKSNADVFDVPNRIIIHGKLVVKAQKWEEVSREEIARNMFKIDSYAMTYSMDHLVQNGIPMSDFAVFNPGLEYEPYTTRNKPQLIPKIVHVIWIQGQMSKIKATIFKMNQALYPDWTFKIWSKDNITRQQFPRCYDLLMNIYKMENVSRYSKRATMADVMRHELLYYEGGFYMDTSMILFNNVFEKWLSYKLALATERTFRHRWAQSMCIFGVMPKFPGLLRIIEQNNTNRYNLWLRDALQIAGPHNFRWTVRGMEEYDPDYLIMDYETFYPMTYTLPSFYETLCFIQPMFLNPRDEAVMEQKGRRLIKDCGKYYPYAFGKEINAIGSSWQAPKW